MGGKITGNHLFFDSFRNMKTIFTVFLWFYLSSFLLPVLLWQYQMRTLKPVMCLVRLCYLRVIYLDYFSSAMKEHLSPSMFNKFAYLNGYTNINFLKECLLISSVCYCRPTAEENRRIKLIIRNIIMRAWFTI